MKHLSHNHEDRPNQHEDSHKLWDETGLLSGLTENQWKLRQQHQNFPMGGKPM